MFVWAVITIFQLYCSVTVNSAVLKSQDSSTLAPYYPEDVANENDPHKLWNQVVLHQMDEFVMPIVRPQQGIHNYVMPVPRPQQSIEPPAMNGFENVNRRFKRQTVTEVNDEPHPVMCGTYHLPRDQSIFICTPNFPSHYSLFVNCDWVFTTDSGTGFLIDCPQFSIASEDAMEIKKYGDNTCISRYENTEGPHLQSFNMSSIQISFSSQWWSTGPGFVCSVRAQEILPPTTTTEAPTTTTEPPVTQDPALSYPECGISDVRENQTQKIVNGNITTIHEYPWQTYLRILWTDKPAQVCGGSLIGNDWILTAGHCVLRLDANNDTITPKVVAYLGMQNRSNPFEDGGVATYASQIVLHPRKSFAFDVALIKLSKPVTFSSAIRPICLPQLPMPTVSDLSMGIVGWGRTEKGSLSTELREMDSLGIGPDECKKVFGHFITDHHFCTSSPAGQHICLGDSGGPVMGLMNGRFFLRGVVSFVATSDCSGVFPDGHSDVEYFMPWVREVTQNELTGNKSISIY